MVFAKSDASTSSKTIEWRESFARGEDGTRIYVREQPSLKVPPRADGLTCLLNDGIACDGFIWKYLWDFLSERTRVVHWHYRGHGRSEIPRDPERIHVSDHTADLDKVRLHVGDPPVVLFGHSFGCQVALEGFRTRPSSVRGLVLICGSSGRVTHTFRGTEALAQVLPGMIERVKAHPLLARGLWGSLPPEFALRVATLTGEIDSKLMDPADLLPYLQHMVDLDLLMFLRMLYDAGEHSAADLLPKIDVPVLVIAGDKDNFTPPRYAEDLARALPKGELLMLPATHVAPLEQKRAVHERVAAFIDALPVEPA
jgi:pimeloyl-ACP methyl ester carboxylesterase